MDPEISHPEISIITSIERDWLDLMPRWLQALEQQQDVACENLEVVVVNGFGDEKLARKIAEQQAKFAVAFSLSFHTMKKCGRAAANNHGIKHSSGNLLLFLADDFVASPRLVEQHLALHRLHPAEHVVGIGPGIFPPEWELSPYMHWLDYGGGLFGTAFVGEHARPPPADFFYGANTSVKRSFIEKAGLFDEDYPYDCGDDAELGIRLRQLGLQSKFLPDAIAYHWHEQGLPDGLARARLSGESVAITDFKLGGETRLRAGIQQRRKTRSQAPKDLESRWKMLFIESFNKAYKNAARKLIKSGLGQANGKRQV